MATVSKPNTFTSSTVISPSEVNSNFDTIYTEFNGNISAANLATSAVSTAKIADSGVTTAKINDLAVTTAKLANSAVDYTKVATGAAVQMVYNTDGAVATGTTTIPGDDTIPQNTEGTQFMSQAITPKSTTNILVIECVVFVAGNQVGLDIVGALFQDTTANALSAKQVWVDTSGRVTEITLRHVMVAGTTSSTTFKLRIGGTSASTITFNGGAGARKFGAISKSSMTITEYKA